MTQLLTCIKCGTPTTPHLDLGDGDTFYCPDCEEHFTVAEVETVVGNWQRMLAWVKRCPSRPENCEIGGAESRSKPIPSTAGV